MSSVIISLLIVTSLSALIILFLIPCNMNLIYKSLGISVDELSTPLNEQSLNEELKMYGFSYISEHDLFYSIMNPWQRKYGYGKTCDEIAPFISIIYDCEPIIFEYNNRKWLIEFWKGQYGMTTGAEIGIYTSEDNDDFIFSSITDEEMLPLSYTLKKKNSILFARSDKHWWLTGFKLGEYTNPSDLIMDISITLKNPNMRDAFVSKLNELGYKKNDLNIDNNTVNLIFNKPYTKQPLARKSFISFVAQQYNKSNCKFYNSYTKDYSNTLDKINFIRKKIPSFYTQIISFEKPEQLFNPFFIRTNYLSK